MYFINDKNEKISLEHGLVLINYDLDWYDENDFDEIVYDLHQLGYELVED